MKRFDWEKNISLVTEHNTFRNFIWRNYTVGQMNDDLTEDREDFVGSADLIGRMLNMMGDEIEEFCDKSEAVQICGGQSDAWIDVQSIQVNTAILRSMREFFREHANLFEQHLDKKISEVISWRPSEIWGQEDIDFSGYKSIEDLIRANCYGRDIIYAYCYGGNSDEPPHVYEADIAKIYKKFGKDIDAYMTAEPQGKKLSKLEKTNLYIQCVMDKIYNASEKELLAAPTLRVNKIVSVNKDLGRE